MKTFFPKIGSPHENCPIGFNRTIYVNAGKGGGLFQEQVAQGGCGGFSGDIQDPPGQGPVQPALGGPALVWGLD